MEERQLSREIGTTACAILALIAVQEGSAYAIAKRMERNNRFMWPRAESHLYAEIKRLEEDGLAKSDDDPVGRRGRKVYRVTRKGRAAISAWLSRPAHPPAFECEALLRVTYADFGSKAELLAQLEATLAHAEQVLALGAAIAVEYANLQVDLPERMHTTRLVWQYLWDHYRMQADWARTAIRQVKRWPDTRPNPAMLAEAQRFFRDKAQEIAGAAAPPRLRRRALPARG